MGMFSSINNAVTKTFDLIGSTAEAAEESVSSGTRMIKRRAQSLDMTDKQSVAISTARKLEEIQTELQADPELTKLYDEVMKELV